MGLSPIHTPTTFGGRVSHLLDTSPKNLPPGQRALTPQQSCQSRRGSNSAYPWTPSPLASSLWLANCEKPGALSSTVASPNHGGKRWLLRPSDLTNRQGLRGERPNHLHYCHSPNTTKERWQVLGLLLVDPWRPVKLGTRWIQPPISVFLFIFTGISPNASGMHSIAKWQMSPSDGLADHWWRNGDWIMSELDEVV